MSDGTGVAYFGHGKDGDVIGTDDMFRIHGLKCLPHFNLPNHEPYSDFVQKQTLKLNSESGIWEVDESRTRFVPTSTCQWTASEDAGGAATFEADQDGNKDKLTFPVEHSLEGVATYQADWEGPTEPKSSL